MVRVLVPWYELVGGGNFCMVRVYDTSIGIMVRVGNGTSLCMVRVGRIYGTSWSWYEMVLVRVGSKVWYEVADCTTAFKINDTSGEISLTTSIDFDNLHNSKMDTFCKLTIEAIDVENPTFKDTVDITIEVLDVNDNPPEFLGSTFDVNIQEDITVIDETMLPLTIDDKDRRQSANGHFDVVVENSDTCPFRAVGRRTTGNEQRLYFILQNNKQINHESTKSYSCNIRATDKGSPSQSASASVTVNVVDVNDNPPIVEDGNYAFNISRFSERGYVVLAQINATDIDSGQNGEIEFIKDTYLSSETAWDFFSLSDTTGLVTLDRSLTVLQLDIVALRVIVQDKGSPTLSTSLEITLTIQDTNVRPYFLVKTKTVHLTEETRYQETPLYIPPIPAYDQGSEETICNCLYRLGTPSDIFEIDSKTASIRLRNNTTIDREEIQALELLVIGEDDGIPPQDNSHDPLVIKVIILDINDMAPRFTQLQYNTTIFQGYPLNTPILTVEANDGDENPITFYEIISFNISIDLAGNHTTSMVAINQTSGELFLTASIDVNSTTNFEIEVAVRASDGERPSFRDEAIVIITVQYDDPNQHFPRFSSALYTKEASKDKIQPGDLLVTVDATDDDIGMNGKITYTLLNGNIRDTFAVNSSTGEVSLRYLFDDRTNVAYGSDIIVLTIMAIDGGIIPKIGFTNVTIVLSGSPPPCSGLTSEQVGEDDTTENNDVTYIVMLFALITVASLLMISNTIFIVLYCKQQSVPDVDNTSTRSNLRFEIGKRFHSNSFSYSSKSQPAFPYSVAYMGNYGEDYGSRQPYSLLAKDFQQERFDEPDYNIPHRHVASFQTSDQRGPPNYVPRRNIVYRSASDPIGWANRPYSTGMIELPPDYPYSMEFPALPEPNVDYPIEDNSPQLPPRRSTFRGLRRTEVSNDREYERRRVAHLYPSVPLYGSII
ncbi:hypothetical protein FSP39_022656 [Pinctada imbricata]|uniref:Cadherin domain-containing protein n=1 Tax=Pinctada imbricata TaxID=66713 RepID=A0AA89C573_PINIB|nr:hypothetical protein FSP39_022656 [Pinctada imbricata]